jgi:hypothetical protein
MGTNPLDEDFFRNLKQFIIIGINEDTTVNVRTNVYNKSDYQSILTTAMLMSTLNKDKFVDEDVDNLH